MATTFDQAWLMTEGRQHWKRHLPRLYARLKNSGKLEASLREAAQATKKAMDALEKTQGMSPAEAWPEVRAEFLILNPSDYSNGTEPLPSET